MLDEMAAEMISQMQIFLAWGSSPPDGFQIQVTSIDGSPMTTAPGHYGNLAEFDPNVTTYTFNAPLSDSDGNGVVWLVAHAVACFECN